VSTARAVHVHNAHPRLQLDRRALTQAVRTLDRHATDFRGGCPAGELSLAFLTDDALARLHADFLDDPSPTDVITFDGSAPFGSAGEICVSADTAARYATLHGRDFSTELTLYVVHGWLHLAGYDDRRPADKKQMRAAEARAMRQLVNAKNLPKFLLQSPRRLIE
jgi:probable rRNA maturation factor